MSFSIVGWLIAARKVSLAESTPTRVKSMQIGGITIHNFRSIEEASIQLGNYNLIVGENNAGKTGIITAIRAFYEDEGFKFSDKNDLPKFVTSDSESWIEIEFYTTEEEQVALKGRLSILRQDLACASVFQVGRTQPRQIRSEQYIRIRAGLTKRIKSDARKLATLMRVVRQHTSIALSWPSRFGEKGEVIR